MKPSTLSYEMVNSIIPSSLRLHSISKRSGFILGQKDVLFQMEYENRSPDFILIYKMLSRQNSIMTVILNVHSLRAQDFRGIFILMRKVIYTNGILYSMGSSGWIINHAWCVSINMYRLCNHK